MKKIQAILIQEERGFTASNNLLRSSLKRAGFDEVVTVPAEPPTQILWKEDRYDHAVIFLGSMILGPVSEEQKYDLIQGKLDNWDAWSKITKAEFISTLRQKLTKEQEDQLTETEPDKEIHQLLDMLPDNKQEFINEPLKKLEEERKTYPRTWAEYIKDAICCGAGLVAMLDGDTVKVLVELDKKLNELKDCEKQGCKKPDIKLPVVILDEVKDITFRPILTEDGKKHEALQDLMKLALPLPPFGSINRSYYRTLARNDAEVLMEIPEYIDQMPAKSTDPVYKSGNAYPFLVMRKVNDQEPGIAVMAADWCNTGGQEFVRWQHASIWLASLACAVTGLKMEELKPRSVKPSYWFLNYDRQETVPNWRRIEGKLSTPVEAPTAPVEGIVRAQLGAREVYEPPCSEAPLILSQETDNILKVKLCNGIVVQLNKNAMQVGYRFDQPAGNETVLAEDSNELEPTHGLSPWEDAKFGGKQIVGPSLKVTYHLFGRDKKQTGALFWTFTPAVKEIEGTTWHCVGEKFTLKTEVDVKHFISPPHKWRLGGAIEDLWTHRFACYGAKRGLVQIRFDKTGFSFSLCSCLISDLDKSEVSDPMRAQFKERGVELSNCTKIGVELAGNKWFIVDGDQKYYIRNNDPLQQLDVYQETTSEPFYWFHSGQPFQMLTYEGKDEARTLWCYATEPACIRSEMRRPPACDYVDLDLQVALGLQKGPELIELPTFWYCFAEHGFDHNLWLAAYDYVRQQIRSHCGIERMYPRPTAMLRYNITYLNDLNSYADAFLPLAKELGFKRIDCGVRYVNDLFFPLHGGIEALRDLCQKAHDAGIEVIFYCGASWHHDGEPKLGDGKQRNCSTEPHLVSQMIEDSWRIKNKDRENIVWKNPDDQSECHTADGLKRKIILLGLDTGWYDVSLGRYDCLREQTRYGEPVAHATDATEYPGVSGVWLDSWSIPNHPDYVNYAKTPDRPAVPTVSKALNYVAKLQNKGYLVLVEGQSPVALDSFWYQEEKYEPMVGNEFCLSGMSPFASQGDGLLDLDLFRLLAYDCAMFQDIRLLADENDAVTKLAKTCNKLMNSIHENLGMPLRVRELSVTNAKDKEPIGTFWECEKGIAIFGLRTANPLCIDLPSIISSYVPVEQHDIRSLEGTTKMQIRLENGRVYLEGQLAAGGVVIIQAALRNESTDLYLPIIQH